MDCRVTLISLITSHSGSRVELAKHWPWLETVSNLSSTLLASVRWEYDPCIGVLVYWRNRTTNLRADNMP